MMHVLYSCSELRDQIELAVRLRQRLVVVYVLFWAASSALPRFVGGVFSSTQDCARNCTAVVARCGVTVCLVNEIESYAS